MSGASPIETRRATREAVQPSLWDRLIDDIPGLDAEIEFLRAGLVKEVDEARIDDILEGGMRALETDDTLTKEQKREMHRLIMRSSSRAQLEEKGIVVSSAVLREAVRRDIEMLFNTERFEAEYLLSDHERLLAQKTLTELMDFPECARSVVNFGVPSFAGRRANDFDLNELARELKEVLAVFEPRLRRDSIKVDVETGDAIGLKIVIDAILMLSPVPERLRLATTIDLDSGRAMTMVDPL